MSLTAAHVWHALDSASCVELATHLYEYARQCRWYRSKAVPVGRVELEDFALLEPSSACALALLRVFLADRASELYLIPLHFVAGDGARAGESSPLIASLRIEDPAAGEPTTGFLLDATASPLFARTLWAAFQDNLQVVAKGGTWRARVFAGQEEMFATPLEPRFAALEQSHSTIVFGSALIFKLLRAVDEGESLELEMAEFLATTPMQRPSPRVLGALTRESAQGSLTLGLVSEYVDNQGSAWLATLDALGRGFRRALDTPPLSDTDLAPRARLSPSALPSTLNALFAPYFGQLELLAQRTAELHLALAGASARSAFVPEPIEPGYLLAVCERVGAALAQVCGELGERRDTFAPSLRAQLDALLTCQSEFDARLHALAELRVSATRIRCHGDYHLGQALFTGDDFVIIDFEGEPGRSPRERRQKHSPLRDVAGMLRSFEYAAETALASEQLSSSEREQLRPLGAAFNGWAALAFVRRYLTVAGKASFIPRSRAEQRGLLELFELEKAVYELSYELNNRPAWLAIPLRGLLRGQSRDTFAELGYVTE